MRYRRHVERDRRPLPGRDRPVARGRLDAERRAARDGRGVERDVVDPQPGVRVVRDLGQDEVGDLGLARGRGEHRPARRDRRGLRLVDQAAFPVVGRELHDVPGRARVADAHRHARAGGRRQLADQQRRRVGLALVAPVAQDRRDVRRRRCARQGVHANPARLAHGQAASLRAVDRAEDQAGVRAVDLVGRLARHRRGVVEADDHVRGAGRGGGDRQDQDEGREQRGRAGAAGRRRTASALDDLHGKRELRAARGRDHLVAPGLARARDVRGEAARGVLERA